VIIVKSKIFLFVFFLITVIPQPASAYLDPGFGSMVWQMIAAVAFGAAFTMKIYWQKIKSFLHNSKKNKIQE